MVGFIDDDRKTHGTRLEGYPVLGGYDVLISMIQDGKLDEIVVSTHLIDVIRLRELENRCAAQAIGLSRLHVDFQRLVTGSPDAAEAHAARPPASSAGRS